ncbi:MAG: response regulator [Deltaproteobacteria bacterium]|nr:response regulator [Deltaproteobacteria bacterium]
MSKNYSAPSSPNSSLPTPNSELRTPNPKLPSPNSSLKILMLEDVPTDADLNEHELRKAGIAFTSRRVDTRDDFIKGLDEFAPDIILADYKLPAFDGLSALEIAKEKSPDAPFIFVTGAMGEEWAVESFKKGATDYVLKDRLYRLAPVVHRAMEEADKAIKRKQAEKKIAEQMDYLVRFEKAAVNREFRIKELRDENEALKKTIKEMEKR